MKDFKLGENDKIASGFKAPDSYFDGLSEKINLKLQHREPKLVPLYRKKNFIYAAAAILILGLGITTYNAITIQTSVTDAVIIENYLASQSSTEENLTELLDSEDIEKLDHYNLDDQAVEDLLARNANLEQYLLN